MKRKQILFLPSCYCCFFLGLGLVAHPIVSSYYTEKHQSQVRTQYQEVVEKVDGEELDAGRKRRLIMNCWLPAPLPLNWRPWTTTAF